MSRSKLIGAMRVRIETPKVEVLLNLISLEQYDTKLLDIVFFVGLVGVDTVDSVLLSSQILIVRFSQSGLELEIKPLTISYQRLVTILPYTAGKGE